MHFLANLIAGIGMIVGSFFGIFHNAPQSNQISYGAYNPSGGGTYRLQSSVGTSDTSLTLSSFKEPVSNIPYTMTYLNSSIEYATIDPQTSVKEFISFTGITQNADGTALLTGVTRGLGFSYPYTSSTTLQQPHSAQAILILSNPPQLTNQYANKNNTDTISAVWTFTALPTTTLTCTIGSQFCDKDYVDSVARAGVSTSTETNGGQVRLGTLAEQANSYNGLPTDPAVLQTKNSTSTCQVVGSYTIVASSTTGKLDPNCISNSPSVSYLMGSSTITTFQSTNATTTSSLYVRNKLNFQTTSASSSVLGVDANGFVTANPPQVSTIVSTSSAMSTNQTSSTTLLTITIPANTLGTNSILRLTAVGAQAPGTTNNCTFDGVLGNGSATSTLPVYSTITGNGGVHSLTTGTIFATTTSSQGWVSSSIDAANAAINHVDGFASTFSNTATLYIAFRAKVITSGTCLLDSATLEKIVQ